MTFTPGTKLGSYEIIALLGVGGMGEVYRARDSKLGREVAIKVLPDAFGRDPERVARFQREAEVLASLNHPNIAMIHDLQQIGDMRFLVLELVEGETLADRIGRGPIPVHDALEAAIQVAAALEAAHEKGIIHRDLKPANIKITPEGRVKVLDFGLAKIEEAEKPAADFSNSPTLVSGHTGSGVILGTAAYMSPEQARGKRLDKRADIWAFGIVLFEMLTGRKAFGGDTVSDILVAVLSQEVDRNALPQTLPPAIHTLIRRCVQRDASQRLRDIGDARIEIAEALSGAPAVPAAATSAAPPTRSRFLVPALAGVIVIMAVALGFTLMRPAPEAAPSWNATRLGGPNTAFQPRISPDGRTLAFLAMVDGSSQVAVMNPDSGAWTVLTKDRTHGYASALTWSRDGARVYYTRYFGVPLGIYSVPALGGDERLVLQNAAGGEQLPDGSMLVVKINDHRQRQIHRYWPADGKLEALPGILLGGSDSLDVPLRVLPDGERAIFWGQSTDHADAPIHLNVLNITSGKVTTVETDTAKDTSGASTLGVTPRGEAVINIAHGDMREIVAIPLDHPNHTRLLFPDPQLGFMEAAPDGGFYVDHSDRPMEVLRFPASGEPVDHLISYPGQVGMLFNSATIYLADGRAIVTMTVGGRKRLMVSGPGKDPVPFVETQEETSTPALLGTDLVAILIAAGKDRKIALVSSRDGRIIRRLPIDAANIQMLTASPDGKNLYYVDSKAVWSVSTEGGEARRIHSGDGVAVMPDGKTLLIQFIDVEHVRWVRLDPDGTEHPIELHSDFHFVPYSPGPNAVGPDGRLVLPIGSPDSWFWSPGIFNPMDGSLRRVPVPFLADYPDPAWTSDGKIVAAAQAYHASIWRYQPVVEKPR